MSNDLRTKTVKAIGQLGVGGAMGRVISLATTLVMARILTPADYGLMAIAMVVIGFVSFFNEVGIGAAIVQRPKITPSEINGCFAVALMASLVLFTATNLASGPVASFMGNPRLGPMVSVLAGAFVLGAFGTVPQALLRKEMRYMAVAGVQMLATIVQSLLCMALAYSGFGVWSLVWGFVASSAVQSLGAFLMAGWRPVGRYGIREAASLVKYGLHITNTRVFWYMYTNADRVVIGKVLGSRPVGIYDMAFSLATLPTSQVTTLATNVAAPLFSKLQDDLPRLTAAILNFTRGIAYLTYPALIGMMACSRELVAVILGDKWDDILVPFFALCLMGLIKSVDPLLSQVLISTGHARKLANYTMMCGVVLSCAMVVGALSGGLFGVSLVWVAVYPLLSVKLLRDTAKVTGMKMRDYYGTLLGVLRGAVAMAVAVLLVRFLALSAGAPVATALVLEVASGVLAYLLWIVYLDRRGVGEIRQVMIDLGISAKRLDRWPFNRGVAA
jgi:O-antigen/teichoic acid export membrane protein